MSETQQKPERALSFWDIESIPNIFMFGVYQEHLSNDDRSRLMFFHLMDDVEMTDDLKKMITAAVFEENKYLDPDKTDLMFLDMKSEQVNRLLVSMFCVDDKSAFANASDNSFLRIAKPNSDLDENTSYPYMIGYNSANYDCTMMSDYFNEVWGFSADGTPRFMSTTAGNMRRFNNLLFASFKDRMPDALEGIEKNIYDNMMRSGLLIDAGKVNDKVYKMPLKRILGMMGMGIFEDSNVKNDKPLKNPKDIAYMFAYNASDCAKLAKLFEHRAYKAQFQLKKGLMESYPDIIYNKKGEVRVNRMKADDTSAKFAQRVLCPDGFLPDIRAVSFEYPKGSGRNILKETREWAEDKFKNHPEVMRDYIGPIFDWYASIEGNNFDSSEHYDQTYPLNGLPAKNVKDFPWPCTSIPYFNADGTFSRTYANFGIGGIHGAEYNQDLYLQDIAEENAKNAKINWFRSVFPTDADVKALKATFEVAGMKYKLSDFATKRKDGTIVYKYAKKTELFVQDKKTGNWNLNKKYVWCSDDEVDHEDFTSYYPCLLMNLKAYENAALGEDRYVQQFDNKGKYGKIMKDKDRPKEERDFYKTLREGTKLILNSASGASDTAYDNPIRMNNVILTMRIIGQLFTWRIAQAQTLEGFKITSTNTDGLYAACDETTRAKCREILERESATIGVGIEPEEMRLISKDANNRIEVSLKGEILSAGGGDTACYEGPIPTKALSHPALIDALLVKYLAQYGVSEIFDPIKAAKILDDMKTNTNPRDMLMFYQQIVNSSEGSCRYIFAMIDDKIRVLQHNNRIFAVKSEAAHLYIANGNNLISRANISDENYAKLCAQGIDPVPYVKRTGQYEKRHDPIATEVLKAYDVDVNQYANTRVIKVSRVPSEQNMFIYNKSLLELSDTLAQSFVDNLDDGFYIQLLENAYGNWCNNPNAKREDDEDSD